MIRRFNIFMNEAGDAGGGGGGAAAGGAAVQTGESGQGSGGAAGAGDAAAGAGNLIPGDQGGGGGSAGASITGTDGGQAGAAAGAGGDSAVAASGFASFIGSDGKFVSGWAEQFGKAHPQFADAIGILSKYQDPVAAMGALVHAQGLVSRKLGDVAAVLKPAPTDSRGIQLMRETLGIPQQVTGYELKPLEKLPDGTAIPAELRGSQGDMDAFAKWAHENNVPKDLAAKLVEFDAQRNVAAFANAKAQFDARQATELAESSAQLKRELGDGYDRGMDLLVRMLERGGMTREEIRTTQAFRDIGVVKALVKLAGEGGEDHLPPSSAQSAGLDAGATARDIVNNKQNPLHEKYWAGDVDTNKKVQALYAQEAAAKRRLAGK